MADTLVILEEMESRFGRIRIYESTRDGSRTFYQDSCFHSRCDTEGVSLVGYIHAMHNALHAAKARKVAVLGCAGGTLATMLARQGCEVTVVDINPYSFELARRYFHLPPEVECVAADARTFLKSTKQHFDGIAMDVFEAGQIPAALTTVEFFRIAAGRLNPGGVMVANVIIDHDLDLLADHVAAGMREASGMPVTLLDDMHESDRNIVIVAGGMQDIALPAGHEPLVVRRELKKMIQRDIRRQALALYDK